VPKSVLNCITVFYEKDEGFISSKNTVSVYDLDHTLYVCGHFVNSKILWWYCNLYDRANGTTHKRQAKNKKCIFNYDQNN